MKKAFLLIAALAIAGCDSSGKSTVGALLRGKSAEEIVATPALNAAAITRGQEIFHGELCWNCHGKDLKGAFDACPNLVDSEWLWGGTPSAMFATIKYGVRNINTTAPGARPTENTRWLVMPRFDRILSIEALNDVAEYTFDIIRGIPGSKKGKDIFDTQCAGCHGEAGKSNTVAGAPALANLSRLEKISREKLTSLIAKDLNGLTRGTDSFAVTPRTMPAWGSSWITGYNDEDIKSLVAYILSMSEVRKSKGHFEAVDKILPAKKK